MTGTRGAEYRLRTQDNDKFFFFYKQDGVKSWESKGIKRELRTQGGVLMTRIEEDKN